MTDQHYSNDKIDAMHSELRSMLVFQNKTLERIEVDGKETKKQVTATNGRVTALEKLNENKKGQNTILASVISIFLVVLAAVAGYFFNQIQILNANQIKLCGNVCDASNK